MKKLPKIDKVLCIQNYGISGTTLIHSLLDGHPQLLTLPGLYGRESYKIWEGICGKTEKIDQEKYKELLDSFASISAKWFDNKNCPHGLDRLGENKEIRLQISKEFFMERMLFYFDEENTISRKDFVVALFYVFNEFYKRDVINDSTLVFPIHSLPKETIDLIAKDFSKVKVLHMIREPVQNMGSLMKHVMTMTPETDFTFAKGLLNCGFWQVLMEKTLQWTITGDTVYGKKPYYPDSENFESRALKLEDTHINSTEVLTRLCKWLGIDWNESLLKSEFMGYTWHNRPESVEQKGLGTKTITQKHNEYLSEFDKSRLRILALKESKYFGYIDDAEFNEGVAKIPLLLLTLWVPFKCELLKKRLKQQFDVASSKLKFANLKVLFAVILFVRFSKRIEKFVNAILIIPILLYRNILNYLFLRFVMIYKLAEILLSSEEKTYVKKL